MTDLYPWIVDDVNRRDAAESSGELQHWPMVELELEEWCVRVLEEEAARYGCTVETLVVAAANQMLTS